MKLRISNTKDSGELDSRAGQIATVGHVLAIIYGLSLTPLHILGRNNLTVPENGLVQH